MGSGHISSPPPALAGRQEARARGPLCGALGGSTQRARPWSEECRLTSQDAPGCGRDAAESGGLTGLGIQPASSALRGPSSGHGGTPLRGGKHNTCSKDTNIQSKEQSLGIAQRHLRSAPRDPSTLPRPSKSTHFIFFPHSHNGSGTRA